MNVDILINLLSPLVVFAAVALVKWLFPKLAGKWVVTAVVPILSALAAVLGSIVVPEAAFWPQLLINLAATWVREVLSQWQKEPTPTP